MMLEGSFCRAWYKRRKKACLTSTSAVSGGCQVIFYLGSWPFDVAQDSYQLGTTPQGQGSRMERIEITEVSRIAGTDMATSSRGQKRFCSISLDPAYCKSITTKCIWGKRKEFAFAYVDDPYQLTLSPIKFWQRPVHNLQTSVYYITSTNLCYQPIDCVLPINSSNTQDKYISIQQYVEFSVETRGQTPITLEQMLYQITSLPTNQHRESTRNES